MSMPSRRHLSANACVLTRSLPRCCRIGIGRWMLSGATPASVQSASMRASSSPFQKTEALLSPPALASIAATAALCSASAVCLASSASARSSCSARLFCSVAADASDRAWASDTSIASCSSDSKIAPVCDPASSLEPHSRRTACHVLRCLPPDLRGCPVVAAGRPDVGSDGQASDAGGGSTGVDVAGGGGVGSGGIGGGGMVGDGGADSSIALAGSGGAASA